MNHLFTARSVVSEGNDEDEKQEPSYQVENSLRKFRKRHEQRNKEKAVFSSTIDNSLKSMDEWEVERGRYGNQEMSNE
jgi:hypothetical protein